MVKVPVYNQAGKEVEQITLRDAIFHTKLNAGLLHEVVVSFLASRREANAHAKNKGEVRGGGKKPWRQKGTGRARHGSIRSPLWRGGGVTFGPRNDRNYSKKVNVKAKRQAACIALTQKVNDKKFIIVDSLTVKESKTKQLVDALKNLPALRNLILVLDAHHTQAAQASKNVKRIDVMSPKNLNAYDVMRHDGVVITKAAVKQLEQHFSTRK
ncbi:MAG: 50S ribosomal protein L4 [Patescibacteria group bacterium]|jgi:large subunit ribosomal protein L4